MSIDKKILKEIQRYHSINNYITEQELPVAPESAGEPALDSAALPPAPADAAAPEATPVTPEKIDVATDDEVTKIDDEGESAEGDSNTEEIDVTDIVKTT
jgi:hypothetical protein